MDVEDKHVFYDKLTYVYLEMPKFNKTEDQLVSMYDKWLFVLKNLTRLMDRPAALQERVFTRLFEQAEIARFTPDESRIYEESLKHYRDLRNVINSAERRGREEGREEGRKEGRKEGLVEGEAIGIAKERESNRRRMLDIAREMKALGSGTDLIMNLTGLTAADLESL